MKSQEITYMMNKIVPFPEQCCLFCGIVYGDLLQCPNCGKQTQILMETDAQFTSGIVSEEILTLMSKNKENAPE